MNPPKLTGSGLSPLANTPVLSLEDTVSWYESEKSHCRSFFDLPKTLQQLLEHFFSEQFIRWHGASIMMDVGNYIFDPSATNLSDRFLNRKKTRIC